MTKRNEYITDAGLNWMSFGARQYDPQLGRFLSVDPMASDGGQDMMSPYHAMGDNPVSVTDPNGTTGQPGGNIGGSADPLVYTYAFIPIFVPIGMGGPSASIDGFTGGFTSSVIHDMTPGMVDHTDVNGISDWGHSNIVDFTRAVQRAGGIVIASTLGDKIIAGQVMNLGPVGAGGSSGGDKGNGGDPQSGSNKDKNTVDNTDQATDHYFDGQGQPVHLGPNTLNALLTSDDFKYHHNRILTGKTDRSRSTGDFSVDMTSSEFYVGRTNVAYSIGCANGTCRVTYTLFTHDGYWDPNFLAENTLGRLGIREYQPDRTGPNLEFSGGTPYWFIPIIKSYIFRNPGYNFTNP